MTTHKPICMPVELILNYKKVRVFDFKKKLVLKLMDLTVYPRVAYVAMYYLI